MKKLLALSIALALMTLTACGPKAAPEAATNSTVTEAAATDNNAAATEEAEEADAIDEDSEEG